MKIKFEDFINEYHGPGKRIGFMSGEDDKKYNISFVVMNDKFSSEQTEENLKKVLDLYKIEYSDFTSEDIGPVAQIGTKQIKCTMFSFIFKSYDDKESGSIIKNILRPFKVVPESISSEPILPWE
jgi:hypothetical protein